MTKLYAFDFDGTLTTRDTLLEFIRYACGTPRFLLGFLIHSPLLVLMKLRLYPNGRTKERIFSWFFLEQAKASGAEILIVSASIDNWVQPFFPSVTVLGTQIEVANGLLTGRFLTPNCYGQEKVRRILALHPDRSAYHLTAYGDSRGDRELLAFADEAHQI